MRIAVLLVFWAVVAQYVYLVNRHKPTRTFVLVILSLLWPFVFFVGGVMTLVAFTVNAVRGVVG